MSTQLPSTQVFNGFYYFKLHGYMLRIEYLSSSDQYIAQKIKITIPVSYYGWI